MRPIIACEQKHYVETDSLIFNGEYFSSAEERLIKEIPGSVKYYPKKDRKKIDNPLMCSILCCLKSAIIPLTNEVVNAKIYAKF